MSVKDNEQDELIRQNTDRIARNEEAITRQTEALEKIRDHYYPKKTLGKSIAGFLLKVVGAITIYTGMMEATEWYINDREITSMAEQSVAVAKRLMFKENDMSGAVTFLERAVELDGKNAKYRTMLGYVRGLATVVELFDLGRPMQADENARVNAIMAEAVFLQEAEPKNPMPYVLSAQANALRKEYALSDQAIEKAIGMAPDNILVRCAGCAMRFFAKDLVTARKELAQAEKLDPDFPMVLYWKAMLAVTIDHDIPSARGCFEKMVRNAPHLALPHAMLGRMLLMEGNLDAAQKELERSLEIDPQSKQAALMMGECYERQKNLVLARMWYDRAIGIDARFMKAILSKARVCEAMADWKAAEAAWSVAINLDPLRAELYDNRAKARETLGDREGAQADRKIVAAISPQH